MHDLSGDKLSALDCYIDCLNIADDSYELHRDVLRLAEGKWYARKTNIGAAVDLNNNDIFASC